MWDTDGFQSLSSYRVTVPATTDPVTLAEAKAHCRVNTSVDDDLISALVKAATHQYQTQTNRQLVEATYQLTFSQWPYPVRDGWGYQQSIVLPMSPLKTLDSVSYSDTNGNVQTFATNSFVVDVSREPGRVTLKPQLLLPNYQYRADAITITYTAGYGAASDVPALDKQAIKFLVGHWYENREPVVVGTITSAVPLAYDSIVTMRKVPQLY